METTSQGLEEEIKAMDTDQPLQAKDLVKKYYKKQIYLSYVLFIVGAVSLFPIPPLGFFIILIAGLMRWWLHSTVAAKINHEFLLRIAAALHYEYKGHGDPSTLSGKIFQIGEQQSMTDVLVGVCENFPLRLFTYRFTIREKVVEDGKRRDRMHPFVYSFFEIEFPSDLPSVAIVSKNIDRNHILSALALEETVRLEGSFNDSFYTYVEKGKQMEIRQILTPDVMVHLMDTTLTYSFFFSGKKLYICMSPLKSKDEYLQADEKMKYFVSKWSPQLIRM